MKCNRKTYKSLYTCALHSVIAVLTAALFILSLHLHSYAAETVSRPDYAKRVLELVNYEREKAGVAMLSWSEIPVSASRLRADEAAVSFSHERPDGRSFYTAFDDTGCHTYMAVGENLATGQRTPEEFVAAWMSSDSHRANILNSDFKELGVSCIDTGDTLIWVQEFYTGRTAPDIKSILNFRKLPDHLPRQAYIISHCRYCHLPAFFGELPLPACFLLPEAGFFTE